MLSLNKRHLFLFLAPFLFMASSLSADSKVSALSTDNSPAGTDLLYEVKNPGGTPASRNVTIATVNAQDHASTNTWTAGQAFSSATITTGSGVAHLTGGTVGVAQVSLSTEVTGTLPSANLSGVYSGVTGLGTQSQALNMNSNPVNNLTEPASPQDAVTKNYVDNLVNGFDWKQACMFGTNAALPTNVYANGSSGVGATLTGVSVGALTVDGYTVTVGQRILVKNEAAPANNGIYTVTAAGSGIAVYVLTRAVDYNQSAEIQAGDAVFVDSGTVNNDSSWLMTTNGTITVGTTGINWTQFAASYSAGGGLKLTGTQFSIDNGSGTLQGNVFNGNSQLVQTTSSGKYPALDGSAISNLTAGNISGVIPSTGTGNAIRYVGSTVTLTSADFGKVIVCTPTVAIQITMPDPTTDVSSQTITIVISTACPNLVSLTSATANDTVDGASVRKMWAGESAVLQPNFLIKGWNKTAGKTIPMAITIQNTLTPTYTSLGVNWNVIPMATLISGPSFMTDGAQVIVQRSGNYTANTAAYTSITGGTPPGYIYLSIGYSGGNPAPNSYAQISPPLGAASGPCPGSFVTNLLNLPVGQTIVTAIYMGTGTGQVFGAPDPATLNVLELPAW